MRGSTFSNHRSDTPGTSCLLTKLLFIIDSIKKSETPETLEMKPPPGPLPPTPEKSLKEMALHGLGLRLLTFWNHRCYIGRSRRMQISIKLIKIKIEAHENCNCSVST
jgi:hypothetical protein